MRVNTGITEDHRREIAGGLSTLLADTYTLFLKTHNYHWNVTGPNFQQLHLLFEQQYSELFLAVDTIAERIRSLGYPAPGSFAQFSKLSSIEEASGTPHAKEMLIDLVHSHELVASTARSFIGAAQAGTDEATTDLLTARLNAHEKTAWMLRSHLEE